MTAPSSSSTNDANTASSQVSAASPSVNTASPQVCTASVSDNTVYAFMVENLNGSNVLHQDLEQIHEDMIGCNGFKVSALFAKVEAKNAEHQEARKVSSESRQHQESKETKKTLQSMLAIEGLKRLGSVVRKSDKIKNFGYSAVLPPHPLIYNRPNKLDLSYSGLDEFKEPEFKGYGPESNKKESNVVCDKESENSKDNYVKSLVKEQVSQVKSSFVKGCGSNTSKSVSEVEPKEVRKNNDALVIEDWVSDDEEQDESKTKPEKKTVIPTAAKIEKPVKKSVRYAEMYRSQSPRGNQRNWNGQKSNQLDEQFVKDVLMMLRQQVNTASLDVKYCSP
ncbi:hypothetical protein Tco_1428433 [Tanacetum coccineum]